MKLAQVQKFYLFIVKLAFKIYSVFQNTYRKVVLKNEYTILQNHYQTFVICKFLYPSKNTYRNYSTDFSYPIPFKKFKRYKLEFQFLKKKFTVGKNLKYIEKL